MNETTEKTELEAQASDAAEAKADENQIAKEENKTEEILEGENVHCCGSCS